MSTCIPRPRDGGLLLFLQLERALKQPDLGARVKHAVERFCSIRRAVTVDDSLYLWLCSCYCCKEEEQVTSVCVGGGGGSRGSPILTFILRSSVEHVVIYSAFPSIVDPSGTVNSSLLSHHSEILTLLLRLCGFKRAWFAPARVHFCPFCFGRPRPVAFGAKPPAQQRAERLSVPAPCDPARIGGCHANAEVRPGEREGERN